MWNESRRGCGCEGFDGRDIFYQLRGKAVPPLQVRRAVIRDPNLSRVILPDQDLERQIHGGAGSGEHEGRPRFWVAEDHEFGGRHLHAGLFCFAAVVDEREEATPFACRIALSFATVSSTLWRLGTSTMPLEAFGDIVFLAIGRFAQL